MICLKDYITIRTCADEALPEGGVFLNDFLPGVEWKMIDQIADADQINWVKVWDDIQNRAIRRFNTDFLSAMQNRFNDNGNAAGYKLKQITQSADIGRIVDKTTTFVAAAEPRGFSIELNYPNATFSNSNLQVIYVQSISVYFASAHNFSVLVKDLDTGDTIDTFPVTGAIGWNLIKVNKKYSGSRRISLTYDSTGIISTSLDIGQHLLNTFNNDFRPYWYWEGDYMLSNFSCGCAARVMGIKGSNVTTSNTYGLSAVFSVKCVYDNIVCNNKEHFLSAWAYLLGSELMFERIYSSRINRWTTIGKGQAEELRIEFELKYGGGSSSTKEQSGITYPGELPSAVYGIQLNENDCCVECDAPVRFVNATT